MSLPPFRVLNDPAGILGRARKRAVNRAIAPGACALVRCRAVSDERLDIRVFGGVRVHRSGEPIAMGGRQERTVLALLVVHRPAGLTGERLVDLLWPDEPPPTAAKVVQVQINRLRATLGSGAIRRSDAYMLDSAVDVDTDAFEALVAEGLAATAGDPLVGLDRLEAALALVSGDPFATESWLDDLRRVAYRLEERTWRAREGRFELLLRLGRTDEILAEIPGLARSAGLRETLWSIWMRTLGGSGRSAEAERVFNEAAATLRDELGVDPSPALTELRARIAAGELRIERIAPEFATALPTPPGQFVGRGRELREIADRLRPGRSRIVTLTGPGGTDKTRLAIAVGQALARAFNGAVGFVDLAAVRDATELWPEIAASLSLDPSDNRPLRRQRALLVIDNTERLGSAVAALESLLAEAPRIQVLISARVPSRIAGEEIVELGPLMAADGRSLFRARARASGAEDESDELVDAICQRLEWLPLAIELAALQARALPGPDLLRALDRRLSTLVGALPESPRRHRAIETTIAWSHDLLTDEERRLFARLAIFEGGWTIAAAEAVCDATLGQLRALVDHSLVRRSGDRMTMLDTIRDYAAARLDESGERPEMLRRHALWFLAEARRQCETADPTMQFRLLAEDVDNQRVALATLCGEPTTDRAAEFADVMWMSWVAAGWTVEGIGWMTRILARPSIPGGPSWALRQTVLGEFYVAAGRMDDGERVKLEALDIARRNGEAASVAATLTDLAGIAGIRGDRVLARARAEEALAIRRAIGRPEGVIHASLPLADLLADDGELDAASELMTDAMRFVDDVGVFSRRTSHFAIFVPLHLARIRWLQGRFAEAARLTADGLDAALVLRMKAAVCDGLDLAAIVLARAGRPGDAARLLGHAVAIRGRFGLGDITIPERAPVEQALRGELGSVVDASLRAEGAALETDDAARLAIELLTAPPGAAA
jgi:predicted ATPase/DNA-binding SARP family transcriptional activator